MVWWEEHQFWNLSLDSAITDANLGSLYKGGRDRAKCCLIQSVSYS